MDRTSIKLKDLLIILSVIFIWGINFVVIKFGLLGVPPLLLACLRFIFAAFPALLFFKPPKVPIKLYLAFGLFMSVGQFAFLFTAIHVGMPSGLASLVLQAQSFFTLLLTVIWLKEKWTSNQLIGLILAAFGLLLIGSSHGSAMPLNGFLLTICAAVMWACGNIVSRAVGKYGPMNQLAFVVWASLIPPIPLLLLSVLIEGSDAIESTFRNFTFTSLSAILYIAWASTLFGYAVWNYMMSRYPVNKVAPFTLLVPLVGLSTGWLVFNENLLSSHFIGGALLMIGLLINIFGANLFRRFSS
jgi:O-acetylserine/cysteine efflux transporter